MSEAKKESELEYFTIHNWMTADSGLRFTIRCGVYAIIYSWHVTNRTCFESKEKLASLLGATKSAVCEALNFLLEDHVMVNQKVDGKWKRVMATDADGQPIPKEPYIIAEKRPAPQSTVYTLNPRHELSKFWTVKNLDSQKSGQSNCQESGQLTVKNLDSNCPESGHNNISITESIKEPLYKRGEAPAENSQSDCFISIQGFEKIRLTAKEYDFLKYQMDYSPTNKTLEAYMQKAITNRKQGRSDFDFIKEKAYEDRARVLTDAEARQKKEREEQYSSYIESQCGSGDAWDSEQPY